MTLIMPVIILEQKPQQTNPVADIQGDKTKDVATWN